MEGFRDSRACRALFALVLGAALVLRAGIPAGWMPTADAGGVRLELCSGVPGNAAALAAEDQARRVFAAALAGTGDMPQPDTHDPPPEPHCAFAGLSTPAFISAAADVPAVVVPPAFAPPFALIAAVGRGLAAPPPPATGPPLLA